MSAVFLKLWKETWQTFIGFDLIFIVKVKIPSAAHTMQPSYYLAKQLFGQMLFFSPLKICF